MEEILGIVSCPTCKGTKVQRYGKASSGKRKYRCLDQFGKGCRRQFIPGSSYMISAEKKSIIVGLIDQGTPPKKIAAAVQDVSVRWVYTLTKRRTSLKRFATSHPENQVVTNG